MDTPQVLLDHHLKTLRLPTFLPSTIKSHSNALLKVSTFRDTCCD